MFTGDERQRPLHLDAGRAALAGPHDDRDQSGIRALAAEPLSLRQRRGARADARQLRQARHAVQAAQPAGPRSGEAPPMKKPKGATIRTQWAKGTGRGQPHNSRTLAKRKAAIKVAPVWTSPPRQS